MQSGAHYVHICCVYLLRMSVHMSRPPAALVDVVFIITYYKMNSKLT